MKQMIYLILGLFLISSATVSAQVAIGTQNDPHPAAILDLKSTSVPGKGLLLPKVDITHVLAFGFLGDETLAEGMIVYCPGKYIAAGIYLWNGNKWQLLLPVEKIESKALRFEKEKVNTKSED